MTGTKTDRLTYHSTSFSQGKMDFSWEALSEDERKKAYADWHAGKGLIGGSPQFIPNSDRLPDWALDRPFFRALSMTDVRSQTLPILQQALASTQTVEIEIGFGRGDFIMDRAARLPDRLFLGYEVKTKAARLCLKRVERQGIANLWISDDDVRFSLPRVVPDRRISIVHVLFPDPWWKDQHRVKRLFSPPFVDLLAQKLTTGGLIFFRSDVQEYGELVRYLLQQQGEFSDHDEHQGDRIGEHAPTHREHWCAQHDKPVFSYYFVRR